MILLLKFQVIHLHVFLFRHCLWIFGNEPTLRNSGSVWKKLITDAKIRGCAYNAHEDKRLAKAIVAALVDADPHPLDISLDIKSLLFEESRWKVNFYCSCILGSKSQLNHFFCLFLYQL